MTKHWWHPEEFRRRIPFLRARSGMRRKLQDYFDNAGFLEVETPALQISPGLEPHLTAFSTTAENQAGKALATYYLHTSPEFAMKKLLAAGALRIYQLARVFRNREDSSTHHPEFTMLEWYRTGEPYSCLVEDCVALVRDCAEFAEGGKLRWQELESDPFAAWEQLTVEEAFRRHAGVELMESLTDATAPDRDALATAARAIGVRTTAEDSWEDIFFRIFLEKIERNLGVGAPTILHDYPVCMAALSRPKPDDPRFAERFELFICGLEVANAFGELTDASEQRARFERDMALKEKLYGFRYPLDEDFLAALEQGLPACSGIALGFDRLVMLVSGAQHIKDVLWAPVAAGDSLL